MLKEMPELRAPENSRTGMEIRPKVKWPDQTDDGIGSLAGFRAGLPQARLGIAKLNGMESLA
jgi:hypothetical protein